MVRIADIVTKAKSEPGIECQLVVDGDMPVQDVLDRMREKGCDHVGIDSAEGAETTILSKEDVLSGLLAELDGIQGLLNDMHKQVGAGIPTDFDSPRQSVYLASAFENISEGLIIICPEGRVEEANPAANKLFGLRTDADRRMLSDVIDRFRFTEYIADDPDGSIQKHGYFTITTDNCKTVQVRWTKMFDASDGFLGTVMLICDVTDDMAEHKAGMEFLSAVSNQTSIPTATIQNSIANIKKWILCQW